MFKKGQRVEMTPEGLRAIRLKPNETIRKHRHGGQLSSTGIVVVVPRDKTQIVVRLDSMPESSEGEYFKAIHWQPIEEDRKQCYGCDCEVEPPGVFRELARGPREGQKIGPLCKDCEDHMESQVLLRKPD